MLRAHSCGSLHCCPRLTLQTLPMWQAQSCRRLSAETGVLHKTIKSPGDFRNTLRRHRQVQKGLTFSSMKFKQPSLGTKAAIFLPFLISWTRAHLRMAELGCLASIPLHSKPAAVQKLVMTSSTYTARVPQMPQILHQQDIATIFDGLVETAVIRQDQQCGRPSTRSAA